ncbi:hypothetical protein Taro_002961 [Colocasia esculenta]|uniref:Retrotransposon gag domain-containing protein n=1 Tax=Colocasia esculenta TaxID=4460 RepID=A0A843TKQ0_COLES|nr:hypothetical protein [Colocasia esculenta]
MASSIISGSLGGYSAEFLSVEQQERFTFVKTKVCGNKTVDVADLEKNGMHSVVAAMSRMQWMGITTFSEVSYPDLVKAFYVCLRTEADGSLVSSVKGTQIKIDHELLHLLFGVKTSGHSGVHTVDAQAKGLGINQEINMAEVMMEMMKFARNHIWDTKSKLNVSLPYAHLLTKVFQHFGVDVSGAVVEKMGQAIQSRNLRKSGFSVVSGVWTKTSVAEGEPILGEAQEVQLEAVAAESEGPSAVAESAAKEAASPSASLEVAAITEVAMETPVAEENSEVADFVRRLEDPLPTSSVASVLHQVLDSIHSSRVDQNIGGSLVDQSMTPGHIEDFVLIDAPIQGEQGRFVEDAPIQGEQNIEIEAAPEEALTEDAPVNAGHNEAPIEVEEQWLNKELSSMKLMLSEVLKAVGPKDPTPQEHGPSGPSEDIAGPSGQVSVDLVERPSGPSAVALAGPSGPSVEVQPSEKVPSEDSVLCQESWLKKESLNPVDPVAEQEDQVVAPEPPASSSLTTPAAPSPPSSSTAPPAPTTFKRPRSRSVSSHQPFSSQLASSPASSTIVPPPPSSLPQPPPASSSAGPSSSGPSTSETFVLPAVTLDSIFNTPTPPSFITIIPEGAQRTQIEIQDIKDEFEVAILRSVLAVGTHSHRTGTFNPVSKKRRLTSSHPVSSEPCYPPLWFSLSISNKQKPIYEEYLQKVVFAHIFGLPFQNLSEHLTTIFPYTHLSKAQQSKIFSMTEAKLKSSGLEATKTCTVNSDEFKLPDIRLGKLLFPFLSESQLGQFRAAIRALSSSAAHTESLQVDFATLVIPDVMFLPPLHALIMDSSVGTLIFERATRVMARLFVQDGRDLSFPRFVFRKYLQGHIKPDVLAPILSECERLSPEEWTKLYPLSAQRLGDLNASQASSNQPPLSPGEFLDANSLHLIRDSYLTWVERYKVFLALKQEFRLLKIDYPLKIEAFLRFASFGSFLTYKLALGSVKLLPRRGLRLHVRRVLCAGRHVDVSLGKTTPYYVMLSGANAPVALHEHVVYVGAQTRVPKGVRHGPTAVWSAGVVLVGLQCSLALLYGAAVGPFVRDCETERWFLCCVVQRSSSACVGRHADIGLGKETPYYVAFRLVPPAIVLVVLCELVLPWGMLQALEDSSSTRLLPLGQLRSRKRKNPWSSSSEAEGDHPGVAIWKATDCAAHSGTRKATAPSRRWERRDHSSDKTDVVIRRRVNGGDKEGVAIRHRDKEHDRKRVAIRSNLISVHYEEECDLVPVGILVATVTLSPSASETRMESYLNLIYGNENQDATFYTSQDYEESLPHDLLEESTRPWVATVHASESHRPNDGGPSQTIHSPQADDQAAQLIRLIPQLDPSQIQNLMTALKGKAASSPSPRAGASCPMASTSGPRVVTGLADNTLIWPRAIRFTPFESEHHRPRELRPRSPPYLPCYSPPSLEPRTRLASRASSLYAQPSAAPDMMSEWASIKKELQELRKQVDPRQRHDVHMPNINGLWVPSPSELPKYRKYNGSGNPYIHIKDFIYESAPYKHDRRLMAYLFHRSLDGPALDWFYSLLPKDAEDFAIVRAKFLEQFQDRVGPEYSLTNLMAEKMKSDEDFATYADRWRQMATRVPGYLPEGEKVKIIIANATPAYKNILAMNDITTMHQLYSRARFI